MSFTQSIPLGEIPDRFEQVGLTNECMVDTLNLLIHQWAAVDHCIHYEMTCNFINSEMDLTEDEAGMFLVYTVDELIRVGSEIRQATLTGRLLAFLVSKYVILLTFADEQIITTPSFNLGAKVMQLQETIASVVINDLKFVGRRDVFKYVELLKQDVIVTESPVEYIKDVWLETPGRFPDDGPARVYPVSLDSLPAMMVVLQEANGGDYFQLGASPKGLEMLLNFAHKPKESEEEQPTQESSPQPYPVMVVGRTGGIIVYGRATDLNLLGISILHDRRVEEVFEDCHLEVRTPGHTEIHLWARDADLLAMLAQAITVVVKKSMVVIMEGKEPRNVFYDGAHVPPPGGVC